MVERIWCEHLPEDKRPSWMIARVVNISERKQLVLCQLCWGALLANVLDAVTTLRLKVGK